MTVVDDHPYAAYTEQADYFEVGLGELDEVLPPFAAGLLAAAGRLLAVLAYRDAVDYGDRPFKRRSPAAKHRVLAWLPKDCDMQDQAFRLEVARAFDDLAADVEAGRAPIPRCTGERRALEIMIDCAPRLMACSDDELCQLGVAVPEADSEYDYRPPCWEELWSEFITRDAEFSIPQAQPVDEEHEPLEPPCEGWAAPEFWFAPYGITRPRDPDRGYPGWVRTALDGGPLVEPDHNGLALAAELFSATMRVDPWRAYTDDSRGHVDTMVLAEILTPLGARLLQAAASELITVAYEEVVAFGDRPWNRDDEDAGLPESFLGLLPPVCDGQNAAWRLAMVRAVSDLADDLRAGCAPLPRCNAEEIALHVILYWAAALVDELDDADLAGYYGLPAREVFTVRHRQFSRMRETFFQDEDVLMFYDLGMADVAAAPDHVAMQYLHVGDIRPVCWWWTFGNLRPRDAARGFPAWVLDRLRTSSPALRFADPAAASTDTTEAAPPLPAGLAEEFERFVGLAQHRFFDRSCAAAMARSLARVLTLLLDTPELSVHRVWMLRERAIIGDELLIVDRDFSIDGYRQTWRLNADQTDQDARSWAPRLLADCAAQVLHRYATAAPELLLGMENTAPPRADSALAQLVNDRLGLLGRVTTLAGFLRHRRRALGLEIPHLAEAAIMPAMVVAAWEAGTPATPSQLIRCAPALQMPETTLVAASHGTRDPSYWPLPPIRTSHAGPLVLRTP